MGRKYDVIINTCMAIRPRMRIVIVVYFRILSLTSNVALLTDLLDIRYHMIRISQPRPRLTLSKYGETGIYL